MPPKALSRNRRSQRAAPDIIPIYDILVDKEKGNAVRDVAKKIQTLAQNDLQAVEKSFFIFILKICGLDSCVEKINWRQPIQSLNDLMQEMSEENNVIVGDLFLINPQSKFHKELITRINNFLEVFLSDELFLLEETQILKTLYEILLAISNSKMRNIRHCSIALSGIMIKILQKMYDDLNEKKRNKKALKILDMISQGYLEHIIKFRLKDVTQEIRQRAFEIANQTFTSFQLGLFNAKRLHQFYTQLLTQNNSKITGLCLRSIIKLFDVDQEKLSLNSKRHMQEYAKQIIKPLQELSLLPKKNSCYAMQALYKIHHLNPALESLKPKIIAKIFQIHGYEKFQEGLKKAVFIFFESLIHFTSKQQLNQHRPKLIVEIVHLLSSINSDELLIRILKYFFEGYPSLFSFDQMFLLLFTEYYHEDGQNVVLHTQQLHILCTMICEFNQFMRNEINKSDVREKEEMSYNKNVLTNSKQIFYDKMPKYRSISYLYLRLFSLLFRPIEGNISNYLSFVYDKTMDIISQEQFISLAEENLDLMSKIVGYCVDIFEFIFDGHVRMEQLMKNFRINSILQKQRFDEVQILKISKLLSKFEIPELIGAGILRKILSIFKRSDQKIIKIQIIQYAYHCHKWFFTSLFHFPSTAKHQQYLEIRNQLMTFLVNTVLESTHEPSVVRFNAFVSICRTLRLISSSSISDLGAVYYEPPHSHMEIIFNYIGEFAIFSEDQSVSQVTMMIAGMGQQSQDKREKILQYLFDVFALGYRLALNKFSLKFIIKFMLSSSLLLKNSIKYFQHFINSLIKSQIATQNNSKFIFWRFFADIMPQIPQEEEQSFNIILTKLVGYYYGFRKNQANTKALLSSKLIVFVADSIDKSISNSNYFILRLVKALLNKTYRRYPKQTLHRLYIFYNTKTERIQDQPINQMREFLMKISKVGKKTVKKSGKNNEDDKSEVEESESSSEDESQDKENEQMNYSRTHLRKEEDIMVRKDDKTPRPSNARNMRSKTKRKS